MLEEFDSGYRAHAQCCALRVLTAAAVEARVFFVLAQRQVDPASTKRRGAEGQRLVCVCVCVGEYVYCIFLKSTCGTEFSSGVEKTEKKIQRRRESRE